MTEPNPSDTPTDEPARPTEGTGWTPADGDSAIEPLDADEEAEGDEEEAEEEGAEEEEAEPGEAPVAPAGPVSRRPPRRLAAPGRAPTPSEVAVHVDDRISAAFVVLVALVFAAILLWGLLGGHHGALTPTRTPAPSPSAVPSVSASPSASGSASVSESPSGSIVSSPSPSGS